MPRLFRRIVTHTLLVAGSVGIALVIGELALRILWCGTRAAHYEQQSGPFLSSNPYWGIWHFPDTDVEHRRACFDVHYRTNDVGIKGDPIRHGVPSIALLGDSFVEGFGNNNDTTAQHFMEGLLGNTYQVLNFGVSGGFSTLDELVLYDNFAKFFRPQVAVLFFTNSNDLEDNLLASERTFIDRELHFVYRQAQSFDEVLAAINAARDQILTEQEKNWWCLYRFLRYAQKAFGYALELRLNMLWEFPPHILRAYQFEEDAETQRAWQIVTASLRRLKEITDHEGTVLVVVDLADPFQIDENWLRLASVKTRERLDPTHPNKRLGGICQQLGIRYYDMYPEVVAYIREHQLRFPYLSFPCDRHYSPLGQELMANLVVRYLTTTGITRSAPPLGDDTSTLGSSAK